VSFRCYCCFSTVLGYVRNRILDDLHWCLIFNGLKISGSFDGIRFEAGTDNTAAVAVATNN